MGIRRIPLVGKKKINSNQHLGSHFKFFLNFGKAANFFRLAKNLFLRSRRRVLFNDLCDRHL
jgi:hypothetical protein